MRTHAALPWAVPGSTGGFRVFLAGRDEFGRSNIGTIDLDDGMRYVPGSERCVLEPGALGAFDDCGVMNACLVGEEGARRLYYVGMTTGCTVPFRSFTGLAVEQGDASFLRFSRSPILERDPVDPFLTAASFVLRIDERWMMWYTSGVRWTVENGAPKHYYHIKYAHSVDGIHWQRDGLVCIDFRPGEYAIARPFVSYDGTRFKMWYSFRGERYRIGYAESADGLTWERMDERAGIEPSPEGWDSEMICYASIFESAGEQYMLYNGNGYGRTGFGIAVRID